MSDYKLSGMVFGKNDGLEKLLPNLNDGLIQGNSEPTHLLKPRDEFEIDIDDSDDKDFYIRQMIFILDNNIMPLKKDKQKIILENYMKFVSSLLIENELKLINKNKDIILISPKPTTL